MQKKMIAMVMAGLMLMTIFGVISVNAAYEKQEVSSDNTGTFANGDTGTLIVFVKIGLSLGVKVDKVVAIAESGENAGKEYELPFYETPWPHYEKNELPLDTLYTVKAFNEGYKTATETGIELDPIHPIEVTLRLSKSKGFSDIIPVIKENNDESADNQRSTSLFTQLLQRFSEHSASNKRTSTTTSAFSIIRDLLSRLR